MSIFTKIIAGEIPSYKIAEDENYIAFLDINPNSKGHTLALPKKEVDKIFELDKDTYDGLMSFSFRVAKALEKTIPCKRIGMSVIGLEVPHVHVHLIPIHHMNEKQFIKKAKKKQEEFVALANRISSNFI